MEGYYEIEDDKKVCINFTPKEKNIILIKMNKFIKNVILDA